jgi:hypothetical protein
MYNMIQIMYNRKHYRLDIIQKLNGLYNLTQIMYNTNQIIHNPSQIMYNPIRIMQH